ncbi:MAG: prepilin-type N-terminal cleavage/methylation domain-containing protein [Phycisphaerales bacterium]|nr:prepilin-type N-terminal cleavage/methylation domain-containing protein [Phycisphaerales bacterium]
MQWSALYIWRRRAAANRSVRRGFTIAEALIAATILAIIAASISMPFVAVAQQMNAASEYEIAVELGEELMEEVLARPFYAPGELAPSPGPEAGETARRLFNAVDDFHGYNEYKGDGAASHMEDYRGAAVSDSSMSRFFRKVKVEYVRLPDQAAADSSYSFVRVTVDVYLDRNVVFSLVRIKTREY